MSINVVSHDGRVFVHLPLPNGMQQGADTTACYQLTTTRFVGTANVLPEGAARAVAHALDDHFGDLIERIRAEAYAQGARDRSRRRKNFSSCFAAGLAEGGCYL